MLRKPYIRPERRWPTPLAEPVRATMGRLDSAVATPKVLPVRSESYRRWVASLPCIVGRIEGYTQCAHPNHGRGLGQKACDLDCFPLCGPRPGHIGHHTEHDLLIDMTLELRRELERHYTRRTQELAQRVGRPELKDAA